MNILFYKWDAYGQEYIESTFRSLNHQVDTIYYVLRSFETEPEFTRLLQSKLSQSSYDLVFSLNYFPVVSKVCQEYHVTYVSWTMDAYLLQLHSTSIFHPCNYIFSFDSKITRDLQDLGLEHVYDLPLAAEENHYKNLQITEKDMQKYHCDISFVGGTYQNKSFLDLLTNLPPWLSGYLEGVIAAQEQVSVYNFLEEMITPKILKELEQYAYLNLGEEFLGSPATVFANSFLGTKVTERERIHLLDAISRQYTLHHYSYSNEDTIKALPYAINCGTVNYYSEMPKVFHCSKINLNMTTRTIPCGIPLRIFDVLASGGFLITNEQADLHNHFIDGEDLVIYYDKQDLLDKIQYYLTHEQERKEIAENGKNKVLSCHTYRHRLEFILSKITE